MTFDDAEPTGGQFFVDQIIQGSHQLSFLTNINQTQDNNSAMKVCIKDNIQANIRYDVCLCNTWTPPFRGVSIVLQESFKGVSGKFKGRVIQLSVKGVYIFPKPFLNPQLSKLLNALIGF